LVYISTNKKWYESCPRNLKTPVKSGFFNAIFGLFAHKNEFVAIFVTNMMQHYTTTHCKPSENIFSNMV